MITCYIVDDEYRSINLLSKFVERTPGLSVIGSCENPVEALAYISANPPDITFTDINMPQLSGIDFSASVSLLTTIIFTTAFPQYAARAFELQAADYLLKPFTYERFKQALYRASFFPVKADKVPRQTIKDHFYIKTEVKGKMVRVNHCNINYIEAAQNYIKIHVDDGKYFTYLTMKEIESAICPEKFYRIHKSFIINSEKIKSVENGAVILENRTMVLIGASYREEFFRRLATNTLVSKRH